MTDTVRFRRGDGAEFYVDKDSPAYERMKADGGFENVTEGAEKSTTPSAEAAATPPVQEGSFAESTTPSAEAAATPPVEEGGLEPAKAGTPNEAPNAPKKSKKKKTK